MNLAVALDAAGRAVDLTGPSQRHRVIGKHGHGWSLSRLVRDRDADVAGPDLGCIAFARAADGERRHHGFGHARSGRARGMRTVAFARNRYLRPSVRWRTDAPPTSASRSGLVDGNGGGGAALAGF